MIRIFFPRRKGVSGEMTQGLAVQEPEAPAAPQCRHHWLIESPHGPTSWGTCKHCGERREFINASQDAFWEGPSVPTGQGDSIAPYTTQIGSSIEDDEGF
jgi:hypothetical protein